MRYSFTPNTIFYSDLPINEEDFNAMVESLKDEDVKVDLDDWSEPPTIDTTRTDEIVDHPRHYADNPTGIECICVTRHMPFNLGNAVKYIWRVAFGGKKGAVPADDLRKAIWYLNDQLELMGQKEEE